MTKLVAVLGMILGVSLAARRASAQEAEHERRFELGARLGYALPFGVLRAEDAENGWSEVALGDVLSGQLPIGVDFGYRLTPALTLGVYGQYGVVFLKEHDEGCPEEAECSAMDLRFGLALRYHLAPDQKLDPWVAVGAGYEVLRGSGEQGGFESTQTYHGFELLNLELGLDVELAERLAVGPFVGLALGQFSSASFETVFGSVERDVSGLHQWLTLGVRGSFEL